MTARAAAAAAVVSLFAVSCGAPRLLKLPSGSRTPAPDGAAAIDQATAACRDISTITIDIAMRGSVGGQRIRGRLSAGLAKPALARLEAVASFGQPAFFFVATNANATLYMPRDRRVARGRPDVLLEALAGVPLDAPALRSVMTGCAVRPDGANAQAIGADWRVTADEDGDVYLHRDAAAAPWRLVTRTTAGWRADYANFDQGLPHAVHLVSTPGGRFDLQLDLSQVELNMPLGPEVFQVQVPASAETISVEELRRSGPLGGK